MASASTYLASLKWTQVNQQTATHRKIPLLTKGKGAVQSKDRGCYIQTHPSKVMLKILQARLQQYMNRELPDVQAGFRKGRGTRDQVANICWIMEKAREFQKNICFYSID